MKSISELRSTPAGRHWPLLLIGVTAIALGLAYFLIYPDDGSPRSFTIAVIPNLFAALVGAGTAYILLRSSDGTEHPSHLAVELTALRESVERITTPDSVVKTRPELPTFKEMFAGAVTIDIAAMSAANLLLRARGVLIERLVAGARLRVVLLDYEDLVAVETWNRLSNPPIRTLPMELLASVGHVKDSFASARIDSGCEVRLSNTQMPFSLIHVTTATSAYVQVELYAFREEPETRINLCYSKDLHPERYQYFVRQFDRLWTDGSREVGPAPTGA